jgi:hypothetical protein
MATRSSSEKFLKDLNKKISHKGIRVLCLDKNKPKSGNCHMYCDIHGDGNTWDTPWITNPHTLNQDFGCPKCSGLYKRSERELIAAIEDVGFDYGVRLGDRNSDYQGNQTRYGIICDVHGNSLQWGRPYDIVANSLANPKTKNKCTKCAGKYQKSNAEKIHFVNKHVNSFGVQVLGWVDESKTQQNDRCLIRCEVHGNGWEWGTPWLPSYGNIPQLKGCPKCNGSYKPGASEYLQMAQEQIDNLKKGNFPRVVITGYHGGFNNVLSYIAAECPSHGNVLTSKGSQPSLRNILKSGLKCYQCERSKTKKTAPPRKIESPPPAENNLFSGIEMVRWDDAQHVGPTSLSSLPRTEDEEIKAQNRLMVNRNRAFEAITKANALIQKNTPSLKIIAVQASLPKSGECQIRCEVHGDGHTWETPWTPSISQLKHGHQCPKCVGKYHEKEVELWRTLTRLPTTEGVTLLGQESEFKGVKTRYSIRCKKHGESNKWKKPYSVIALLLKKRKFIQCPKCELNAAVSDEEKRESLNSFLKDQNLSVTAWANKDRTGVDDPCLVTCEKHGNGWEWNTPWTPTSYQLKTGMPCPKCAGNYKHTAAEYLQHLQSKVDEFRDQEKPTLTITGYVGGFKRGNSLLYVNCEVHGDVRRRKGGHPRAYNIIHEGVICQACENPVKDALLRDRAKPSRIKLRESAAETAALKDKAFVAQLSDALKQNNMRLVHIEDGRKSDRLVTLSCETHGDATLWANPWRPSASSLETYLKKENRQGCPKCANLYIPAEEEYLAELTENASARGLTFEGLLETFKSSTHTKVKLSCSKHGNGWEWKRPWAPTIRNFLNSDKGCTRCTKTVTRTPEERIAEANEKLNASGVKVIGLHGEFKGALSHVKATCEKHGNGWEWDPQWLPTFDRIRAGKGCPKCSGMYSENESVVVAKAIAGAEERGIILNGLLTKYKGVSTLADVSCPKHGRGEEMNPKWKPQLRQLIAKSCACKVCLKNNGSVNSYITAAENGDKGNLRILYYIAFKNANKRFYKIGLAPEGGGVDRRYTPKGLEDDGVDILWYTEVELDNGIAMLLESAILSYFYDDRDFSCINILKNSAGGTECFKKNILRNIDFHELLQYITNNYSAIRANEPHGYSHLTKISNKRLLDYVQSQEGSVPIGFPDEYFQFNGIRRQSSDKENQQLRQAQLNLDIDTMTDTTRRPSNIVLTKKIKTSKPRQRDKKRIPTPSDAMLESSNTSPTNTPTMACRETDDISQADAPTMIYYEIDNPVGSLFFSQEDMAFFTPVSARSVLRRLSVWSTGLKDKVQQLFVAFGR